VWLLMKKGTHREKIRPGTVKGFTSSMGVPNTLLYHLAVSNLSRLEA
jgi:hypothetical protein